MKNGLEETINSVLDEIDDSVSRRVRLNEEKGEIWVDLHIVE